MRSSRKWGYRVRYQADIVVTFVKTPKSWGKSGRVLSFALRQLISFGPHFMHIYGTKVRNTSLEVTDFLRRNEKMAGLLPTAMRMASLQSDCAAALPAMFSHCDVLSFQDAQLVLATPSSAVAAKLKQQLPKLQLALHKKGWQVDAIKLKVQVTRSIPPVVHTRQLVLPQTAITAFDELGDTLAPNSQNAGLIAALKAMAARRR